MITATLSSAAILCIAWCPTLSTCQMQKSKESVNASGNSFTRHVKTRMGFFDQELFKVLTEEYGEENLVVSPITVRLLLTMLMEASEGAARDQLLRALRLTDDLNLTRRNIKTIITSNQMDLGVSLDLSARVFIASDLKINEDYAKVLRQFYKSDLTKINVKHPDQVVETINNWVNESTQGVIPTLVNADQITSDTAAILASAVHFNGGWKKPFEETTEGYFKGLNGKRIESTFMHQLDYYRYSDVKMLNAQVLELPYTLPRFSMLIFLPHGNVRDLVRDLPYVSVQKIADELDVKYVNLSLPRFTVEWGHDIKNILLKLKITEVFSPTATFTAFEKITNATYRIESIYHAAKITVNESGTVAAGAAGFQIRPNIDAYLENVTVTVDKPFVFFIRDTSTSMTLFSGIVVEPDQLNNEDDLQSISDKQEISPTFNETSELIDTPVLHTKVDTGNIPSKHTTPPPVYRFTTVKSSTVDYEE